MEKRRHRRYSRRFRVKFGEKAPSQTGFTSDVSATGMFVVTPRVPKLGTRRHVEVTIDNDRMLYFEGMVARMTLVAPELRSVMKGGFGLRFLTGAELMAEMVPHLRDPKRLVLAYGTIEALADAYERELKRGGAFVWSDREQQVSSIVNLEIDAQFSGRQLAFECRVVHVVTEQGRWGVALMFLDPNAALAGISGMLGR
ncbi:MAG: PilZ domain-containing protein [Myxococcaceae bacterium]|nr:PilZ domain-containing protein [Myxococcaceae bacterium]